jgi:hypothetical protein
MLVGTEVEDAVQLGEPLLDCVVRRSRVQRESRARVGGRSRGGRPVVAVGDTIAHATLGGPFVTDPDAPKGVAYNALWMTPSQVWVVATTSSSTARADG